MRRKYDVRKGYLSAQSAQAYDVKRFGHFLGRIIDRQERRSLMNAIQFCQTPKDGKVCDIACGTGRMIETLVDNKYAAVGVDISLQMLRFARTKSRIADSSVCLSVMDATALALKDASFALATSMRFFGHIDREERITMLREMSRVTTNDLIVEYLSLFSLHTLYRLFRRVYLGGFSGYPVTMADLLKETRRAGLRVRKVIPILRSVHQGWVVILEKDQTEDTGRVA